MLSLPCDYFGHVRDAVSMTTLAQVSKGARESRRSLRSLCGTIQVKRVDKEWIKNEGMVDKGERERRGVRKRQTDSQNRVKTARVLRVVPFETSRTI